MAQQGDETILEEAKNLLVQGKRFMALEDYQSATDSLEQSCQLFDAFYGVAKRECADAYFEYGLALVALANLEAGSGADKIMKKAGIEDEDDDEEEGDDEEEDEEEEEEEQENEEGRVENGAEENGREAAKKTEDDGDKDVKMDENEVSPSETNENGTVKNGLETKKTNGVADTSNVATTTTTTTEQQAPQASSSTSDPTPGTSDGTAGDDKDDDNVDNEEATTIEVAWEVLCLAKRLFMTDESLEGRLKLAETLQKLGEISIEWDNNDNAVSILDECLKIRQAILKPDDRLIAVTYYHLGLAHSFKSETQNANENFQNAINVIEKRITTLNEYLEKAKAIQDTVAVGTYQKELSELKELLPDLTMRIDDSKEDSVKSTEVLKRTREEMQQEDEEAKKVCSDKSKPVDDISHLVKRKAA